MSFSNLLPDLGLLFSGLLFPAWIVASIFLFSCSGKDIPLPSPRPEKEEGFFVIVDYGEEKIAYFYPSLQKETDLLDILAGMSLRNEPSMRFISTKDSVEIYDIMGIRNNFYKEWTVYVDGKWVPGEKLKKGITVDQNSEIILRYAKAYRIFLPPPDKK